MSSASTGPGTHTTAQITHQLGYTRITIRKYLDQGGFPRRESRATSPRRGT